ncbi:serine/threonine-protein kinase [Streptomyces sp. NBC_01497]|uniref:serine/threonine-protein kinase n=1 Tax=Streptomyces sp. NBC_01497 TaxID=2903885 RepID=UPI002E35E22D|nr:serine/threonine-protein kinase [Streptomyces sp. NBC_01497]
MQPLPHAADPTRLAPAQGHPDYAGRYPLESVLGSGGMGVVHLATSGSGLRLAVKVVHAQYASDPEFRARFRQEIAAARRVSGAFTAPVVDADPDAERPWMATLFIDGPTLADRVKRDGPLGAGELARLGAGLAEGLRDIHRAGVVHRDLKPSNVLLAPDGPRVIDFGISRAADSDLRTETGKLIGTPPFMAPEQFQRPREVGPPADVFAMAAVLVHAATGRGPFDSESPYVVAYQVVHDEPDLSGVPAALVPLVRRCLAKDPGHRPTPDEVMAELRPVRTASTSLVPHAPQAPPPPRHTPEAPDSEQTRVPHGAGRSPRAADAPHASPARTVDGAAPAADAATHPRAERPLAGAAGRVARRPRTVRRGVLALAGLLALAVAAAGYAGLRTADAEPGGATGGGSAAHAFHPWHTALRTGTGTSRTPVCAAGPAPSGALYCSAPGVLAARLNPADGHLTWSVRGRATADTVAGDTAPVISGGLLYVTSATGGERLEALDPATGHVRWSTSVAGFPTVRHTPGAVLLVSADGRRVRSLDGATGAVRWTRPLAARSTVWADPDGAGRALYSVAPAPDGTASTLSVLDPATGSVTWSARVEGALSPVRESGGTLWALSQRADGTTDSVVRIDAGGAQAPSAGERAGGRADGATGTRAGASGPTVRRVRLPDPVDQAQATVTGGIAYVMSYAGTLTALDTRAGVPRPVLWTLETAVTRASRPTADGDGHVYVMAGDGRLLAVDARRGTLLAQTAPRLGAQRSTVAAALPAPFVTAGGAEVVASAPDGSVFAVDARRPSDW